MTSTLLTPQASPKKISFGEPKLQTDGEVLLVSFGKDGSLFSIEELGVLRKWNPDSGEQIEWHSLSDMETLWAASSDGRVFASASDDLTIWDASSGIMLTSIPQPSWVTALSFQRESGFVATGHDDGSIRYWDAPGHHSLFESGPAGHKRAISAVAVSPDGKYLAAASEDKDVSLWNLETKTLVGKLSGHTDRIPALAWHPSGHLLVSAGWDTTARVWDVKTLQPLILLNSHSTQVTAIAFSQDGRMLACADSSLSVHVWDFDQKRTMQKLKGPRVEIRTLAFHPDGRYLAANGDRVLHVWDPRTGQTIGNLGSRSVAKTGVSIHPDGSRLLSNGGGTAARIWDTASRQVITTLESKKPVQTLAFSPDGQWIAGAVGNHIRLWDAAGNSVAEWDGPEEPITSLAFSPDGKTLASASSQGLTVWIWRVADGEPILLIPDALEGCAIEALAFRADNETLAVGGIDWMATGGSNGAISLWNLKERCEVTTFFEGTMALASHPTRDLLASATLDNSICLWDLQKQQLHQELLGHEGSIQCLAFSPDGAWLVSGSDDYTLRVWDLHGEERANLEMESQVTALAFSRDGQYLYTGHANTTCSQFQVSDLVRRS